MNSCQKHGPYDFTGDCPFCWTPGSLAEAVSDLRSTSACRQAAAVEGLVRAARAVVLMEGQHVSLSDLIGAINALRPFVEAAEKWKP
jgi:hypothetical protein